MFTITKRNEMEKDKNRENPEYGRPYDDCGECGENYYLDENNSRLYTYDDFPSADNILTLSDCCDVYTRIFLPVDSESREAVRYYDIPEFHSRVPDESVMKMYLALYEIPEIQQKDLTPRQDRSILFGRYLLDYGFINPEDFEK